MPDATEKYPVVEHDLVMLERSLRLKALSNFEHDLIDNISQRYRQYGQRMVITIAQRAILKTLSTRYMDTNSWFTKDERE